MATPKFEFFSDRLEITSAGGLPYGVTEEDFFNGYSSPRNKEIMRVFRDLDIVEHLGSGVPRILEKYGREAFEIRPNFLRIVFKYEEAFAETPAYGLNVAEAMPVEKTTQKTTQKILAILRDDPSISRADISKMLGDITEEGVKYQLNKLKTQGLIRRIGPAKGGRWEVLVNNDE